MKLEWNGGKIKSGLDKGVLEGLIKSCELVESQAKALAPVDTGQLRDTMVYEVDDKEGRVGSPMEYAEYVEFGTMHQAQQSFLRPAFRENRQNIISYLGDAIRFEVE